MIRAGDVLNQIYSFTQRECRMVIYSLFDRKLKEYGPLVVSNNDAAVRRALIDGVPGSGSTIAKYPEDFDLMCLGLFDAETGKIVAEAPRLVDNVGSLLPRITRDSDAPNG